MRTSSARILEIKLDQNGFYSAQIDCPPDMFPDPGQYLHVHNPDETDSVLGWSLFPIGLDSPRGLIAGPISSNWGPGTLLQLRGPLGRGFQIPEVVSRLALVALDETALRLLPLISSALDKKADIAIFTANQLPALPAAIEIQPLSAISTALAWANFIALDLPWQLIPELRQILSLAPHEFLACPAQALISTPMPCAGIGECGACAVEGRREQLLACKDGPVFDLNALKW